MFHRLTDFMKNGIDRFLSRELSPEEIEEMRLDEGLRLEDVKRESLDDILEMFGHIDHEQEAISNDPFMGPFNPTDPLHQCFRVYDFDARNPNDD